MLGEKASAEAFPAPQLYMNSSVGRLSSLTTARTLSLPRPSFPGPGRHFPFRGAEKHSFAFASSSMLFTWAMMDLLDSGESYNLTVPL